MPRNELTIQENFSAALLKWFDIAGRKNLPWNKSRTSYRVWVAEVMLQQTQVKTVLRYFPAFMKSFPTLERLSRAKIETVLAHWAGLGYYARGRNLHKTAYLVRKELPTTYDELVALPGIGRSTAGAILALSAEQRYPVLDANVKRLLERYFKPSDDLNRSARLKKLWQLAEKLLPSTRVADYTQALMDFGATVCTPHPLCLKCPLAPDCATQGSTQAQVRERAMLSRKKRPTLHKFVVVAQQANKVLLQKRPPRGVWGGLYSLPEFNDSMALQHWCRIYMTPKAAPVALDSFFHTLTHLRFCIHPFVLKLPDAKHNPKVEKDMLWYKLRSVVAVPAPVKKILANL